MGQIKFINTKDILNKLRMDKISIELILSGTWAFFQRGEAEDYLVRTCLEEQRFWPLDSKGNLGDPIEKEPENFNEYDQLIFLTK